MVHKFLAKERHKVGGYMATGYYGGPRPALPWLGSVYVAKSCKASPLQKLYFGNGVGNGTFGEAYQPDCLEEDKEV